MFWLIHMFRLICLLCLLVSNNGFGYLQTNPDLLLSKKKREREREERKKKKRALEHVYHDFLKEKLFWNTLFLHCFIIHSEEKKCTRACLSWLFERKHVLKCFISSLFYNPFWSFFFFIISWCIMQQCYVCMSYCLV